MKKGRYWRAFKFESPYHRLVPGENGTVVHSFFLRTTVTKLFVLAGSSGKVEVAERMEVEFASDLDAEISTSDIVYRKQYPSILPRRSSVKLHLK